MSVSMPITTVVPSLDGPVLVALSATTTPMGLAAVHARAGRGSMSGVRTVLLRMVDEGLVLDVPSGYVLNRDHLATPAVELLATLHGELTSRIRNTAATWPTRPALVGLFGSAARRDGDSNSDIDVLIVSDDPGLDDRVEELADNIRRWTGNRAHVIGRTPAEITRLRRAKEPILAEWDRDLQTIVGERAALGEVASDAACCARLGERSRGQSHTEAVGLLRTVEPGGSEMTKDLQRLLSRKDDSQYGVAFVSRAEANRMVSWARRLAGLARHAVEA